MAMGFLNQMRAVPDHRVAGMVTFPQTPRPTSSGNARMRDPLSAKFPDLRLLKQNRREVGRMGAKRLYSDFGIVAPSVSEDGAVSRLRVQTAPTSTKAARVCLRCA
jgi:hypothetical protein